MRPPRPVPVTADAAMPSSAMIFRAAGSAVAPSERGGVAPPAPAGAGLAALAAGALATAAAALVDAAALPSVSITAITSFEVTVDPSGRVISVSTPSPGAGSSSTTLSVSTSIRFSSRLTASPGFLCQLTSVASATDSGNCGTLTSILIVRPSSGFASSSRKHHLAGLERRGKRLLDQLPLLGIVLGRIADCGRRRDGPACVGEHFFGIDVGAQVEVQPVPCTLVL